MKANGKSNNEVAKFLYATRTPNASQRTSVPTILRDRVAKKAEAKC
jgi:hypothetical protein